MHAQTSLSSSDDKSVVTETSARSWLIQPDMVGLGLASVLHDGSTKPGTLLFFARRRLPIRTIGVKTRQRVDSAPSRTLANCIRLTGACVPIREQSPGRRRVFAGIGPYR